MFKVGDILKANMNEAEEQYQGCKGTTVYNTLIKRAENYRFEVIGVTPGDYTLRRLSDGKENVWSKNQVHSDLVLAEKEESESEKEV
jgi:hypothetical protein